MNEPDDDCGGQDRRHELGDLNEGRPFPYPKNRHASEWQDDWRDDLQPDLDRPDHR